MATKQERDLDAELGPSPWPMYADEEEPWTDHERMLKLAEQFSYQYEIAHVLDCTPSRVSYWMEKAENNWKPKLADEEFECRYFKVCGYETPNSDSLCPTCLSLVRHNDSADGFDPDEASDLTEHIQTLYAEYDGFTVNTP